MNPSMYALIVTLGQVRDLTERHAPEHHWHALADALEAEHTAGELAGLLLGACALLGGSAHGR